MFGVSSEEKRIKTALQICECDMELIKNWMKDFDRMCHQMAGVTNVYETARAALRCVDEVASAMEQILKQHIQLSKEQINGLNSQAKVLKNQSQVYIHPFVVSSDDREFASTYESVIQQAAQIAKGDTNVLLFQSEIENLLALINEKFQIEKPDMQMLTYFLLHHEENELLELPPQKRFDRLNDVYEMEYEEPILREVCKGIVKARTMASSGYQKLQKIQILLELPEQLPIEEQGQLLLDRLKRG